MKKYIKYLSVGLLLVSLASCLKDKGFDEAKTGHDLTDVTKVIELAIANSPANGRTVGLAYKDTLVEAAVLTVRLAAKDPAPEDIKVTVDTTGEQTYIDTFNVKNSKTIQRLPNSFYTLPATGLVITIPKGQREASLVIKTNAIIYNTSTTYAKYFAIKSVDKAGYIISQNFGSYFTQLGAKNKYDGLYEVTGTFVDVTNATFVSNYPRTYHLVTTGANTVDVRQQINTSIDCGYLFLAGTGGSFFGNFGVSLTFDLNTDVITDARNYYGVTSNAANQVGNPALGTGAPLFAASNTRRAVLDPSGINAYNANTKAIDIKYFMLQPSIPATLPSSIRCRFSENMVYIGPRP